MSQAAEINTSLMEAYNQAWDRYEARCLWNVRRFDHPTVDDARHVAQRLRQHGDMNARRLANHIDVEAGRADANSEFLLSPDLIERIDKLCARQGCSRSDLINKLLSCAVRTAERQQDVADALNGD